MSTYLYFFTQKPTSKEADLLRRHCKQSGRILAGTQYGPKEDRPKALEAASLLGALLVEVGEDGELIFTEPDRSTPPPVRPLPLHSAPPPVVGPPKEKPKARKRRPNKAVLATARRVRPEIEALQADGADTLQQLADGLTARGVATPSGKLGKWQANQVTRTLKAIEALNEQESAH